MALMEGSINEALVGIDMVMLRGIQRLPLSPFSMSEHSKVTELGIYLLTGYFRINAVVAKLTPAKVKLERVSHPKANNEYSV